MRAAQPAGKAQGCPAFNPLRRTIMPPEEAYQWLVQHSRETAYLQSMGHLLGWDQRTQIPPKGHEHRHNQFAMLAKWIHARVTGPRVGEALARVEASELAADPGAAVAVNLREWRRDYDRATKIPQELAVALAKATAEGETAWERTRPDNDWETFKPFLARIIALKREEAQALRAVAQIGLGLVFFQGQNRYKVPKSSLTAGNY